MSTSVIVIVVSILCCSASGVSTKVVGRVLDTEGAAIKDAHVLLHPDTAGEVPTGTRPEITRETDDEGRFEVEAKPGFYDVCVMAVAFTPQCQKVFVKEGQVTHHAIRMKADPLVVQHLGDKFNGIRRDQ